MYQINTLYLINLSQITMVPAAEPAKIYYEQTELNFRLVFSIGFVILAIIQTWSSIRFLMHTKHIKEIPYLPKVMVILAFFPGIASTSFWSYEYWNKAPASIPIVITYGTVNGIPMLINVALLVKFSRAQVQLRASKENTKSIIKAMRLSKRIEKLYIALIVVLLISISLVSIPITK